VETAANGREALEKFHQNEFDLVITDRGMPEMNGDALAEAIKEESPQMPIIMLTGFGEMMLSTEGRPEGVDVILAKPVTPAALRQAVTALRAEYAARD
jgi:YesN/AraC family two-component response regulator